MRALIVLCGLAAIARADGGSLATRPIDKQLYQTPIAVKGPVTLRWDFAKAQTLRWRTVTDADQLFFSTDLVVAVPTDGAARATVVLESGQATLARGGKERQLDVPENHVGEITPDGALSTGADNAPIRMLFALPTAPVVVGDAASIELGIATKLPGADALVTTPVAMRLVRVVRCGAHRCAQLEWSFATERSLTSFVLKAEGHGVTYFDIDRGRLDAADVYFRIAMLDKNDKARVIPGLTNFARIRPKP